MKEEERSLEELRVDLAVNRYVIELMKLVLLYTDSPSFQAMVELLRNKAKDEDVPWAEILFAYQRIKGE